MMSTLNKKIEQNEKKFMKNMKKMENIEKNVDRHNTEMQKDMIKKKMNFDIIFRYIDDVNKLAHDI